MFGINYALDPSVRPQPFSGRHIFRRSEIESLVRCYGANSSSYVLLEGAKSYFMSHRARGFIAYEVRAGVAVIGGDPVCAPQDASALLEDFMQAMKPLPVCAYQVTGEMLKAFRRVGFDDLQIGKEAIIDLTRFSLLGGEMEMLRTKVNNVRRSGVRIIEHHPCAPGARTLNSELQVINIKWLCRKGKREKGFLIGRLDLERRTAKRYFVARSGFGTGRVEAFIVCEPIYGRNGYHLSITRQRADAEPGTMELLTTETFRRLAREGCAVASLGVAPLANLDDPDLARHPRLARLMRFSYERIEGADDFKSIFRDKAQYRPHAWDPLYLCFRPRMSPRILRATWQVRDAATPGEVLRAVVGGVVGGEHSRFKEMSLKQKFQVTSASCQHAASFVAGFCAAILLL